MRSFFSCFPSNSSIVADDPGFNILVCAHTHKHTHTHTHTHTAQQLSTQTHLAMALDDSIGVGFE